MYFFIYETKGLSLEEVDELYNDMKAKGIWAAPKSTEWTPSTTFRQRNSVAQGAEFGEKDAGLEHSEGAAV